MQRKAQDGLEVASPCSYSHGFGNGPTRCEGKGEKSNFFVIAWVEDRNKEGREKTAGLPIVPLIRCRSSHKSVGGRVSQQLISYTCAPRRS
jgi:hypothetical protein